MKEEVLKGEVVELNNFEVKEYKKLLAEQEEEIEEGQQQAVRAFVKIGNALKVIRDDKLYKATHSQFEEYCQQRWNLGRNYVNKMIGAAEYVSTLGTIVPIPTHESHVRELIGLEPGEAAQVIEKAGPKPTATKLKETRQNLFPKSKRVNVTERTGGPNEEQRDRLRELVVEARMEGFRPDDIRQMLLPTVPLADINGIIKDAKSKNIHFIPALEDLKIPAPVNWMTGDGCEDGWAQAPIPKVNIFAQDIVRPAKQYLELLRQRRTLNAVGHRVVQKDEDLTDLSKTIDDLHNYLGLIKSVIADEALALRASKIAEPGTAAEDQLSL